MNVKEFIKENQTLDVSVSTIEGMPDVCGFSIMSFKYEYVHIKLRGSFPFNTFRGCVFKLKGFSELFSIYSIDYRTMHGREDITIYYE